MKLHSRLSPLLAGLAVLLTVVSGDDAVRAQSASPTVACTVESLQAKASPGTTITVATVVAATGSVPRYCQVDGYTVSPGNTVNFRLGLPDGWNGKYYFVGVGGLGGVIGPLTAGLSRGYASASTDTGHVASDPDWGKNAAKEIDYGHRGTHVSAVAGKSLTAAFYGAPVQHAYFDGCSNGGRQALMEVQRYPNDFDGIIAGDPATGTPMQAGRALVYQKMLAGPDHYLTASKIDALSRATLAACDASDGLVDGLVTDPRRCHFSPASLRCTQGDRPDCLTDPQLEVVEQIYGGARLPSGDIYAHGFPVGHEGGATGWQAWISGPVAPVAQPNGQLEYQTTRLPNGYALAEQNMRFLALEGDTDPTLTWRTFRLDRDLPRMKAMSDILSPLDPDLRPYRARNGKLLLYHGWSDPAISAYGTVSYYDKVKAVVGGQQAIDQFAALYLVPGMHHCSGGPGPNTFDMLTVLEQWVERGVAPAAVTATHTTNGVVDRTRPLCPHPQVATYRGQGSIDDAANFRCAVPAL